MRGASFVCTPAPTLRRRTPSETHVPDSRSHIASARRLARIPACPITTPTPATSPRSACASRAPATAERRSAADAAAERRRQPAAPARPPQPAPHRRRPRRGRRPRSAAPAPARSRRRSAGQRRRRQQASGERRDFAGGRDGNRRDRFRNRRDRQRERCRDGGMQDDGGNGETFVPRPHPQVPRRLPAVLARRPQAHARARSCWTSPNSCSIHEGVARARKQDVIFALLKVLTRHGEGVAADGVLEILPDGFGFLRAAEASYLAGPDDTYISPSQIRRFNLRTGDHLVRPHPLPEGRRALLRAVRWSTRINGEPLEASKNKVLFENLTPLFPRRSFTLERGNGQHRGHHRPHPRPDGAAGQRPARADRLAAEGRQDDDDAAGRHGDHAQPPGRAPDRAADRRAPGRSDRDAAHRARRSDLLDLRRAGRAPRAGRRDGDRARQAPGRAQEATW